MKFREIVEAAAPLKVVQVSGVLRQNGKPEPMSYIIFEKDLEKFVPLFFSNPTDLSKSATVNDVKIEPLDPTREIYVRWAKDNRSMAKRAAQWFKANMAREQGQKTPLQKLQEIFPEQVLDGKQLLEIINPIFRELYPKAKLYVFTSDQGYKITTDKTGEASFLGSDEVTGSEHFTISMAASVALEEEHLLDAMIWIADADAGSYRGVITPFFAKVYERLEALANKPERAQYKIKLQKSLVIDRDNSDGAWQRIARALNVKYVDNGL